MPITNVGISLKSQFANTSGTEILQGIAGDVITATIAFTCTDTFSAIDFLFGLPNNSLQPDSYVNVGYSFAPETSLQQQFTGLKNTDLSPISNVGWHFGEAEFTDLGSNNYQIIHSFIISPLPQIATDTPPQFVSNESIKYVFQIRTKTSQYTTTPITVYDSKALPNQNGNVGYLNEVYNGFPPIYTLAQTVANNPNQKLVFNIKMNPAQALPLSVGLTGVRVIQKYDINKNIDTNYKRAFAFVPVNGVETNGQNITAIKANLLDLTTIQIEVTLSANWFVGEDFILYATIGKQENSETDVVRNAVFLGQYSAGQIPPAPACGFVVGQHPDLPFEGFGFVYHNDLNRYFSDVKGFSQDGIIGFAKFDLFPNLTLQKLLVELYVATSKPVILEKYEILRTIDTSKGYILGASDEFNDVEFDFASLELKYSFKLRYEDWLLAIQTNSPSDTQDWQRYPAVFLRVSGFMTNGTFQYVYQNISNAIVINNFEESTANTTDANITGAIQLFDGATLLNDLNADGLTTIVATFNGLNAFNLGVASINELWGVIRLDKFNGGGGVLNIREFSTIRLPELNTPFTSLDTSGLAVLQNYTGNTVELVGLIDARRLSSLGYNPNDCIVLSARLGRIQPAVTTGSYASPCCISTQTITVNTVNQPELQLPCNSIQNIIVNNSCPPVVPSPPPVNTNYTQRNVTCGTSISAPTNGAGFFVDTMILPAGTGEVTFAYDAISVPDRWILELDGTIIHDTGFVSSTFGTSGADSYNTQLANSDFDQSFIDSYTAFYGSPPPAQLAIQGNNGNHKFNKTNNATQTLRIITYAPLGGTACTYQFDCSKIGAAPTYPANLCYLPIGYPFVVTGGISGTFEQNGQNFDNKPVYELDKTNQTDAGLFENWVLFWRWNQGLNVWQLLRSINNSALVVVDTIANIFGTTTNSWILTQAVCPQRSICYSGNTQDFLQGAYSISDDTILFNSELIWQKEIPGGVVAGTYQWRYLASGWRLMQDNPLGIGNNNIDNRTTNSINIVGLTTNAFANTDNGTSINC